MNRLVTRLRFFAADDRGATAIEYALIAAIVSMSIVVWAGNIKTGLTTVYSSVGTTLSGAAAN
jgi:pilus assembly protein Flp/PilA